MICSSDIINMTSFELGVQDMIHHLTYDQRECVVVLARDRAGGDRPFVQLRVRREDAATGGMGWGSGGKRYLSEHMTPTELINVLFGLFMAYEEHECREWFRYKGLAVNGPHTSLEARMEAARHTETRKAR